MEILTYLLINVKPMEVMEYAFYVFKLVIMGVLALAFFYAWTKIRGEKEPTIHNHYYGSKKK